MFDEIKINKDHGLKSELKLHFYIESIFDSNITQMLPDLITVKPKSIYDICKAIYDTVEYYYNKHAIYVYPYIAVEKYSNVFMDMHTISLYKLYSILTGYDMYNISKTPITYTVDFNHSNMSNKCINNIRMIFSTDENDKPFCKLDDVSKLYSEDFTLDNVSESDRAIVYAILKSLSYDSHITKILRKSDYIYRNIGEGEMEFNFYTNMGTNSFCIQYTDETFKLDLTNNNVYDLILYAIELSKKYNRRIHIPHSYFEEFDSKYLDSLLIRTVLLEFIDIPHELREVLLDKHVFEIIPLIKDSDNSFGFYSSDNIRAIDITSIDGDITHRVIFDELDIKESHKRIFSIVWDLFSGITLQMTHEQFDKIINN